MPDPGTRSEVREVTARIWIEVRIRTQWEHDHWIAEYHGITATGETEPQAIDRLAGCLELKRWRLDVV